MFTPAKLVLLFSAREYRNNGSKLDGIVGGGSDHLKTVDEIVENTQADTDIARAEVNELTDAIVAEQTARFTALDPNFPEHR